jgi:hypothetical protein
VTTRGKDPITRAALERSGVECIEVEIDELMKGRGAVHFVTGVIKLDPQYGVAGGEAWSPSSQCDASERHPPDLRLLCH